MAGKNLHDELIVFDGLIVSNWQRSVFEDMRAGGLTGANCTCCVWENFAGTMANIARWKAWITENDDLLRQAYTTEDIRRAKRERRTAVVLGFQNVSAFEDQLGHIRLFKELGVGIVQMAYNTQNLIGSGCYESNDGGLSDFGREAVAEMNRVGIMCDLSHVGPKTSEDVIRASSAPVCYSHVAPAGLKSHPRNKSDEQIRFIVDHGGFVALPPARHGFDGRRLCRGDRLRHQRRRRRCGRLRHRLHARLRQAVLRLDHAGQGLCPKTHRVRRDHAARGHRDHRQDTEPDRGDAARRLAGTEDPQGDGRELAACPRRGLGRLIARYFCSDIPTLHHGVNCSA
jgi:Membrane dipeptidase (Peptidase family M19)